MKGSIERGRRREHACLCPLPAFPPGSQHRGCHTVPAPPPRHLSSDNSPTGSRLSPPFSRWGNRGTREELLAQGCTAGRGRGGGGDTKHTWHGPEHTAAPPQPVFSPHPQAQLPWPPFRPQRPECRPPAAASQAGTSLTWWVGPSPGLGLSDLPWNRDNRTSSGRTGVHRWVPAALPPWNLTPPPPATPPSLTDPAGVAHPPGMVSRPSALTHSVQTGRLPHLREQEKPTNSWF